MSIFSAITKMQKLIDSHVSESQAPKKPQTDNISIEAAVLHTENLEKALPDKTCAKACSADTTQEFVVEASDSDTSEAEDPIDVEEVTTTNYCTWRKYYY